MIITVGWWLNSVGVERCVDTEKSHESEQTSSQLRDEQQRRKQLEKQLTELHETNTELTAAKDAAETVKKLKTN